MSDEPRDRKGDTIASLFVEVVNRFNSRGDDAPMVFQLRADCGHVYTISVGVIEADDTNCKDKPKRPTLTLVPNDGGIH